jgi:hypothetical protein
VPCTERGFARSDSKTGIPGTAAHSGRQKSPKTVDRNAFVVIDDDEHERHAVGPCRVDPRKSSRSAPGSRNAVHGCTRPPGALDAGDANRRFGGGAFAPGAVTIYSGKLFPEWKGNFLIAGLSSQALVRLVLENDRVVGEERLLTDLRERMREVVEGPDGALYLLTDDADDAKLLKLTPRSRG